MSLCPVMSFSAYRQVHVRDSKLTRMIDRNLFVCPLGGVTRSHPLQPQYNVGVVIVDLTQVPQSVGCLEG
jgi:hypothetical protein